MLLGGGILSLKIKCNKSERFKELLLMDINEGK